MEKKNYNKEMLDIIASLPKDKPTLLLHSCCGPCSTSVLERITDSFKVTVFYFNPNITESEEYELRLSEQKRFLKERYGDEVKLIEGRYFSREFFIMAEGLEKEPEGGKRCEKCYEMRTEETAKTAKDGGFDYFCSTLSVSPHKNAELLNLLGEKYAKKYGVKFLPNDFKKDDGFKRSTVLAKEYSLYRQNYCGCIFSKYVNLDLGEEN